MRRLTDEQIELIAKCEESVVKCLALASKLKRNKLVVLSHAYTNAANNLKASIGMQARILREDESLLQWGEPASIEPADKPSL